MNHEDEFNWFLVSIIISSVSRFVLYFCGINFDIIEVKNNVDLSDNDVLSIRFKRIIGENLDV